MRTRGRIVEYHNVNNGYGWLITTNGIKVKFNKIDCKYNFIRVGDIVRLDLFLDDNHKYITSNIHLITNEEVSKLKGYYLNQHPVKCKVINKLDGNYVLQYKSTLIFLRVDDDSEKILIPGEEVSVYIKELSFGSIIRATFNQSLQAQLYLKYLPYIGTNTSFNFKIDNILEQGLYVVKDGDIGFVPNSHIIPLKKDDLKIGDNIEVFVKGSNPDRGLVLSVRNCLGENVLAELKTAYKEYLTLNGIVIELGITYHVVDYKGIYLKLNKYFCLQDNLSVGTEILFKVIDINSKLGISISEIETSNQNILPLICNQNIFRVQIKQILHHGVLVKLNDLYTGFISFDRMSDDLRPEDYIDKLKIGSTLRAKVYTFNYLGILLSRTNVKYHNKLNYMLNKSKINSKVIVNSRNNIFGAGLIVKNKYLSGLIKINSIIPEIVIEQIDIKEFISFCKNIYIHPNSYKCIILKVGKNRESFEMDFDYSANENMLLVKKLLMYFIDNDELLNIVQNFYINKIKFQIRNAINIVKAEKID